MIHSKLNIFDVSGLIYAGHYANKYKTNNDSVILPSSADGLPIGGVRYTLRIAFQRLIDNEDVLFVFDSPTDKQELFADYKGNRTHDSAILVQQMILKDIAAGSGIPFLCEDNYEADDLIAAAVPALLANYSEICIFTGDADVYANIISPNVYVCGSASIYPSVSVSTYEHVAKKSSRIFYNSILPYFAIYGKESNNVPGIGDKAIRDQLYLAFWNYSVASQTAPGYFSTKSHFANWLLFELQKETPEFSSEIISELYSRIGYVFPKDYTKEIHQPICDIKQIASEAEFYLKACNMDSILTDLQLIDTAFNPKTKEMLEYLKRYKQTYFTGTLAVDNDAVADISFFEGGETSFFLEAGDI